jgi:hypothetical protein
MSKSYNRTERATMSADRWEAATRRKGKGRKCEELDLDIQALLEELKAER